MKVALIIVVLAAAYLAGQLFSVWRSRKSDLPPPPPGGWRKGGDWDEDDDWPKPPGS